MALPLPTEGAGLTPGTLFPSEDGLDPGSAEPAQDITGFDLPADTPQPQQAAGEPTTIAADNIEPPTERKGRSAAERIAQLTRRYRAESSARSNVEDQLARLTEIVEKQNNQLRAINTRPLLAPASVQHDAFGLAEGASPVSPNPPYTVGYAVPAQGGANVSADDIAAAVTKAIDGYDQKQRRERVEQEHLKETQLTSFQEAADEIPELSDARTRTHKLFMELYSGSPLRHLPDAPYQIALQVRGILADEAAHRASPGELEARKRQASNITPLPTSELPSGVDRAALQKEYASIKESLKNGDTDPRTFVRWRKVREALQKSGRQ